MLYLGFVSHVFVLFSCIPFYASCFFLFPFFFFLFAGSCGVRGERAAWAEGTEARAEAKAVQTDDFRAGDGPPTYIAVVFPPLARLGVVSDVKARGRFSV